MPKSKPNITKTTVINPTKRASKSKVEIITTTKSKKGSRGKRKPRTANWLKPSRERQLFAHYITHPDLFPPMRMPRQAAARTGLGSDHTIVTFGSTSTFSLGTMAPSYGYGGAFQLYSSATQTNSWVSSANIAPGSQFPNINQIDDVVLTAASITVTYIGPPLTAKGMVYMGTIPVTVPTSTNFNTMAYLPGVTGVPCASLIDNPLRAYAVRISPHGDEFIPPNNLMSDWMIPFIMATDLTDAGALQVSIVRHWEYRTSIATGQSIPYDSSSGSLHSDYAALTDACSEVSSSNAQVNLASDKETLSDIKHASSLAWGLPLVGSSLLTLGGVALRMARANHQIHRHSVYNPQLL